MKKKLSTVFLILVIVLTPTCTFAIDETREQLLEGALINRYLGLIGGTLQKQFGCEKVISIRRLGDTTIPYFEVKIQVVTYSQEYGKLPYDLVTLTIQDRVDLMQLSGIEKKWNISSEEYKSNCGWFKR